jgi:hypothetical protein
MLDNTGGERPTIPLTDAEKQRYRERSPHSKL